MEKRSLNKKAQSWGMDLIVAVMIFTFGIFVFFLYTLNSNSENKETFEKLNYEGRFIMETILSEGYPENWNSSNVAKIGILDNDKINQTKLSFFYELAGNDYNNTKVLFNTVYDYYFFLENNLTIESDEIEGIGKPGENKESIESNSENLIKITRFTIYEEKPVTAYLYIWEN